MFIGYPKELMRITEEVRILKELKSMRSSASYSNSYLANKSVETYLVSDDILNMAEQIVKTSLIDYLESHPQRLIDEKTKKEDK